MNLRTWKERRRIHNLNQAGQIETLREGTIEAEATPNRTPTIPYRFEEALDVAIHQCQAVEQLTVVFGKRKDQRCIEGGDGHVIIAEIQTNDDSPVFGQIPPSIFHAAEHALDQPCLLFFLPTFKDKSHSQDFLLLSNFSPIEQSYPRVLFNILPLYPPLNSYQLSINLSPPSPLPPSTSSPCALLANQNKSPMAMVTPMEIPMEKMAPMALPMGLPMAPTVRASLSIVLQRLIFNSSSPWFHRRSNQIESSPRSKQPIPTCWRFLEQCIEFSDH